VAIKGMPVGMIYKEGFCWLMTISNHTSDIDEAVDWTAMARCSINLRNNAKQLYEKYCQSKQTPLLRLLIQKLMSIRLPESRI